MGVFAVEGSAFIYDGEPVRLLSGAMHYFRIVPELWRDRLLKLKACGLNTVETYVAWNVHEPNEDEFRFEGMADVCAYIALAGSLGLHVIVRPSPYICAEFEFGGLPAWLLADSDMQLRCSHPAFLRKVDAYYDELLPRLKPLLCTNGGPIIAVQIENEYGSYGNDARYLEYLRQALLVRGIDVPLFTSDGPTDALLQGGSVPGVLATVNFGSNPGSSFDKLKEYRPNAPLMCMEYWNGWFDHWGKPHHTRGAAEVAAVLEEMLSAGASVNFYLFHGGTNFGFGSGANCQEPNLYEPTITSYDYDALLDESGEPTDKYFAVREVIARYSNVEPLPLPPAADRQAYGRVELSEQADLFEQLDVLSAPIRSVAPMPMEKLGQNYGYILYTTRVSGPRPEERLFVQEVRDRALVFVDGAYQGVIERAPTMQSLPIAIPAEGARLDILVENMGRINYGPYLKDAKGITEGVRLGFQFLFDWTIRPLPLADLSGLHYARGRSADRSSDRSIVYSANLSTGRPADSSIVLSAGLPTNLTAALSAAHPDSRTAGLPAATEEPRFYKGTFQTASCADTFLDMQGWTKGVVFVNGFHLGRYWNKGPQRTLYVPAPLLRKGGNEIVIFELHHTREAAVVFTDRPMLGQPYE
ncbi:glycoside hydrolase family 35 protein [Paenibacillus sacheonensis]|uniref:glycoside hydrolase family 35 protein n=1 Tax=Paenibacillus sacheonensis TaxID=742054 RepID=UPI001EF95509|nr:beta-galactosidase family protein [Paenibacillus sacheonensis]MBM7566041.1 beta-galactosidase [Paenibacillus sacheonensis]